MKHLTKKVRNLDILDIKLMHLAMVFLTLFVLLLIPQFMNWVHGQSKWLMLGIAVVLFIRPCSKFWKK
jgi:predicted branched-subunit amino acid permease